MIEAAMIWNEPNNKSHWDPELDPGWEIYADMVIRAGEAIASANPDVVRVLGKEGAAALDHSVRSAMTTKVQSCNEHHTVHEVMEIMTNGRFRHLPVEKDGHLDGIVSIGDVVKRRIEDAERETDQIRAYIATA